MVTKISVADPPRRSLAAHSSQDTDGLVARFRPGRRAKIRKLVSQSPRFADLAMVFPGALHAIASRPATHKGRRSAIDLVLAGAPLRDVSAALDLPLWLRRLPPEAFSDFTYAPPRSDIFARRIANHLPTSAENSAFWLKSITFGARACDEYFALWLAQQAVFHEDGDPERLFGLLAAYAWFSNDTRSRTRNLIVVPWRPVMNLETAVCAAKSWLNRIRLVVQLKPGTLTDPWLDAGEALGLTFQPLLDSDAILAEATAMQNCADQYADRLTRDRCRLFSVRRRGVRVATLEIGPHPREAGVLAIAQLKARHNLPATVEIWQAAHTWLGAQSNLRRLRTGDIAERQFDTSAWSDLFARYRAHAGGAAWIPARADTETFAEIEGGIGELARRLCVTSWLFT